MVSIEHAFAGSGNSEGSGRSSPRLIGAAREFEAQMMKELLSPLDGQGSLTGEEDDGGLGSAGALGAFASEALGRALSEQGGLGIAYRLVRSLEHRNQAAGPETARD
jgi:hypothetical protein